MFLSRRNKISQHENCYISEIPEYFAPNFAQLFVTILCTNVLLCAVFTRHFCVKLTETQTSRTNFTTEQIVDFIIKATEQRVPPLL